MHLFELLRVQGSPKPKTDLVFVEGSCPESGIYQCVPPCPGPCPAGTRPRITRPSRQSRRYNSCPSTDPNPSGLKDSVSLGGDVPVLQIRLIRNRIRDTPVSPPFTLLTHESVRRSSLLTLPSFSGPCIKDEAEIHCVSSTVTELFGVRSLAGDRPWRSLWSLEGGILSRC